MRITRLSNFHEFHEHSLTFLVWMRWYTFHGHGHHALLKQYTGSIEKSNFDVSNLHLDISQSTTVAIRMNWKMRLALINKASTSSKTNLNSSAGKVKTFHYCLQVSNIAVHMYPASQSMQIKFCQWNFVDDILTEKKPYPSKLLPTYIHCKKWSVDTTPLV